MGIGYEIDSDSRYERPVVVGIRRLIFFSFFSCLISN